MTLLGRLMSLFPACALALDVTALAWLIKRPSLLAAAAFLASVYLLPPVSFRVHGLFFPVKATVVDLSKPTYCPWWGGHQIQLLYDAVPAVEAILRLIPGVYSLWLRLWGSSVGRRVYWTPTMRIADRSLMTIGDGVLFGHNSECFCHIVSMRKGAPVLFVRPIRIEDGAFIGGCAQVGPGAVLEQGSILGAFVRLWPGVRVLRGVEVPACSDISSFANVDSSNVATWGPGHSVVARAQAQSPGAPD